MNNIKKMNDLLNNDKTDTLAEEANSTTEIFSISEIQELFQIKNQINNFIEQINREPQPKTLKDKINLVNKYILKLIKYLDSLSIWEYRFSTENNTTPNQEKLSNDSIYYISKKGISLRLKIEDNVFGLEKVINPFMEKLFFVSPDEKEISFVPKQGYIVKEYSTQEFDNLFSSESILENQEFVSKIKTQYTQGIPIGVKIKTDFDKYVKHTGHKVNRIKKLE